VDNKLFNCHRTVI